MRQYSLGEQEKKHRFENRLVLDEWGMSIWFCGWSNVLLMVCWRKYQLMVMFSPIFRPIVMDKPWNFFGKSHIQFRFYWFWLWCLIQSCIQEEKIWSWNCPYGTLSPKTPPPLSLPSHGLLLPGYSWGLLVRIRTGLKAWLFGSLPPSLLTYTMGFWLL